MYAEVKPTVLVSPRPPNQSPFTWHWILVVLVVALFLSPICILILIGIWLFAEAFLTYLAFAQFKRRD